VPLGRPALPVRRNPYTPSARRRRVVDLEETPAVPPFDGKGDERAGLFIAGGVLILFGWGVALGANALFHALAPAAGFHLYDLQVGSRWGAEGLAVALLGAFTGAMGVVLLQLGRESPRGPIVLPGGEF